MFIQEFFIENALCFYYTVAAFGAIPIFFQLFIILRGIWRMLFRRKLNLISKYGEGSWVLVTGSSEGIGKEFALQFAKQGFNILLLSRAESKLKAVRQEIIGLYPGVKVEVIVADLVQEGKKQNLKEVLPELDQFKDISIIVNNAGVAVFDYYTNIKATEIIDLINLNCFALGTINYKFIPYFEQRMLKTSKKCAFINVASAAGELPMPLHNVYSASKGYIAQLTNNLSIEYPDIDWLSLNPAIVTTGMTFYRKDATSVTAEQCVSSALRDFGYEIQANGATSHKIQSYMSRLMPLWLFNLLWMKVLAPPRLQFQKQQKNKSKSE